MTLPHENVQLPPLLQRFYHRRFTGMLASLILLLTMAPVVMTVASRTGRAFSSFLLGVAFVIVYLSAVYTVSKKRQQLKIASGLSLVTIGAMAAALATDTVLVWELANLVSMILLAYVIVLTLEYLFRVDQVTIDTIAAAICVYLLMGILWAFVYSLTSQLNPDAFSQDHVPSELAMLVTTDSSGRQPIRFAGLDTGTGLYFSFVTLTTLGYGDITPQSTPARMLTAAEAIVGQIYLTVLVARLVGLHISQRGGSSSES